MKISFIVRLLVVMCGVALLSCSCKGEEKCGEIKKPKDLKPIDWENYNDVYTVYWNYKINGCSKYGLTGEIVKVSGWIFQGKGEPYHPPVNPTDFQLMSNEENIFSHNPYERGGVTLSVRYYGSSEDLESLKAKFSTTDITKKCYVSGEIFIDELMDDTCCYPYLIIFSNNIHFEEEEL